MGVRVMRRLLVVVVCSFLAPSFALAQSQQTLEQLYKQHAAEIAAGALSTTPPPNPEVDLSAPPDPSVPTLESTKLARQAPGPRAIEGLDDSVKWLLFAGALVIVWQVIKALSRGAKTMSKAVLTAAVEASPAVKQAATRVSSTALGGAKSFFAETKKCPNCAELIKKEAKVCRFCQRSVS